VELVVFVCLAANVATCEEQHLSVALEPVPQSTCMMKAMPYLAKWAGDHPQFVIKKWRCAVAGADGEDI
jgi:hypothetical protein